MEARFSTTVPRYSPLIVWTAPGLPRWAARAAGDRIPVCNDNSCARRGCTYPLPTSSRL